MVVYSQYPKALLDQMVNWFDFGYIIWTLLVILKRKRHEADTVKLQAACDEKTICDKDEPTDKSFGTF